MLAFFSSGSVIIIESAAWVCLYALCAKLDNNRCSCPRNIKMSPVLLYNPSTCVFIRTITCVLLFISFIIFVVCLGSELTAQNNKGIIMKKSDVV